jgi:hypothetical protein
MWAWASRFERAAAGRSTGSGSGRADGSEYSKTFRTKKAALDFERTQQADQAPSAA